MIRNDIAEVVRQGIAAAQASGSLPAFEIPTVEIGRPKDPKHGDYAANIAMQLAKPARMAPLAIAQAITAHLPAHPALGEAQVLPPGFINFRLSDAWLAGQVAEIEASGGQYGNIDLGRGQSCQVEFISANPTGQLHMGSARNAVLGDSLGNLLAAAGWQVQREYYVNDAGTQMRTFAETVLLRYKQALGLDAPLDKQHYQGAEIIDLAREVVAEYGDRFLQMADEEAITELREIGLAKVLAGIRQTVERLRIHFDCWYSEASLYEPGGRFEHVLTHLRNIGMTTHRDGAEWLLTSEMGSDRDEVIVRSTGQPGYYASDIAYHYDKFVLRGFDRVIDVWAVDHQNQARRMPYLMKALGLDPQRLDILLYDIVRLYRDGQEVKLSKRSGNVITIDEVVDEVGVDAVRFLLLTRSNQAVMDFDLNLAVAQKDENRAFYVQYAHARMASILRKAAERGFPAARWANGNLDLLRHPAELTLLRKVADLSEVIERAVLDLAPHNLAFYAQDLAKLFHAFYRDCRVLPGREDDAAGEDVAAPETEVTAELSEARLRLVAATKSVFARVLGLLGVNAPESM